jgi:catechol 2,3-dioxygenase-like lactoylglutathione lyase family enzyme
MNENWKFHHICIVVRDLDKAINHFANLDIGPFPPCIGGPEGRPVTGTVYGEVSDYDMDLRLAEGGIGGIHFELIQPLKGKSIYDEYLENKGEGVHHLAFVVENLDSESKEMENRGFKIIQTGTDKKAKWAYFNTGSIGGCIIELIQKL